MWLSDLTLTCHRTTICNSQTYLSWIGRLGETYLCALFARNSHSMGGVPWWNYLPVGSDVGYSKCCGSTAAKSKNSVVNSLPYSNNPRNRLQHVNLIVKFIKTRSDWTALGLVRKWMRYVYVWLNRSWSTGGWKLQTRLPQSRFSINVDIIIVLEQVSAIYLPASSCRGLRSGWTSGFVRADVGYRINITLSPSQTFRLYSGRAMKVTATHWVNKMG